MRYRDQDGHIFEADAALDLVKQLNASSFAQAETPEAYMREMSARHRKIAGDQRIRTASPEAFIADLVTFGFLKVVSDTQAQQTEMKLD